MPGQTVAVQMGAERNVALARTISVPGAEVVVALAAAERSSGLVELGLVAAADGDPGAPLQERLGTGKPDP